MADNEPTTDEYHFADLDELSPEEVNHDSESSSDINAFDRSSSYEPNHMKRNVIFVVILFILFMLAYKFGSAYFSKPSAMQPIVPVVNTPTPALPAESALQPEQAPAPLTPPDNTAQLDQTLSSLEQRQQTMSANIDAVNDHLGTLGEQVTQLGSKLAELNSVISTLNDKLAQQSHQIELLTIKPRPVVLPSSSRRSRADHTRYHLQAIIPGRAWLIGSNGVTVTVREGTLLPGYGAVRLIDAEQGRVLMSTGKIIRFSQSDS